MKKFTFDSFLGSSKLIYARHMHNRLLNSKWKQSMRRVADWQIGHYNRVVMVIPIANATFSWDLLIEQRSPRKDDQDDFYYKWLTRPGKS